MNSKKYNLLRLSLILLGLIPSFISIFLLRKKKRITICSEFNKEFNHNSKYLFLYLIDQHPDFDVKFVINDSFRRKNLTSKYGDFFVTTFSLEGLWFILTSYTWITSSLETPISGFFLAFRRKVIHLGHGAPLKNIGLGEGSKRFVKKVYYRIVKTNFSHFLSTSECFDETWRRCLGMKNTSIVRSPQARNEMIQSTSSLVKSGRRRVILYAPTWRPYSETSLFPFEDFSVEKLDYFLESNNLFVDLRLHPNFEESLCKELTTINNVSVSSKRDLDDINTTLGSYDLLITDYSSIYIDFLLTEKPLVFLPYDIEFYRDIIGFSIDYDLHTPGPKPTSFESFTSEILKLLDNNEYYLEARRNMNQILNPYKVGHVEGCANAVFSIIQID